MRTFFWSLGFTVALAAIAGLYSLSGGVGLNISPSLPAVDIRFNCPKDLAADYGVDVQGMAATQRALHENGHQIETAEIFVDRAAPTPDASTDLARFAFTLKTPDGNTIVSSTHRAPFHNLDQAMAERISRAMEEYLHLSQTHGLTGKGVILENF